MLSWADDGAVRLWDVSAADTLQSFDGRADTIRKAQHLDGGRQVLTWGKNLGGKDLVFRVWDAASGESSGRSPSQRRSLRDGARPS